MDKQEGKDMIYTNKVNLNAEKIRTICADRYLYKRKFQLLAGINPRTAKMILECPGDTISVRTSTLYKIAEALGLAPQDLVK